MPKKKMLKKIYKKSIYITILHFVIIVTSVFICQINAYASYDEISNRIPDDNYRLDYPSIGNASSTEECTTLTFRAGSPQCIANMSTFQDSHQYITLAGGRFNNAVTDTDYPAQGMDLVVYSKGRPTVPRNITISFTNRGIEDRLACQGYRIYASSGSTLDSATPPDGMCNGRGVKLISINTAAFSQIKYPNPNLPGDMIATNIYKANLLISIKSSDGRSPDVRSQSSFHLSVDGGSKIGYRETVNDTRWVNQYPTAIAKKHTMQFKFRPPCGTREGTRIQLSWDAGDNGTRYQPFSENGRVRVVKVRADGTRVATVATYPLGSSVQTHYISSENYSGGRPYSYSVEFENIYGGNGISFRYPFDSGDFNLECPDNREKWVIGPYSDVRVQAGQYNVQNNASGSPDYFASIQKMVDAFKQARFSVGSFPWSDITAPSGQHTWTVKYKFLRAGESLSATGSGERTKTWSTYTATIPGKSDPEAPFGPVKMFTDDSQVPTNGVNGISYLYSNAGRTGLAAVRIPQPGDQYCEYLVIKSIDSRKGSTYPSNRSDWKCVELNGACRSVPYTVGSSSYADFQGGGGNQSDAWVGSRYHFHYELFNNGPASTTDDIARWRIGSFGDSVGRAFQLLNNGDPSDPNSADRADRGALGWTPFDFYDYEVRPEDAGKTYTDALVYQPISKDSNCNFGGASHQQQQVTIPYYYHVVPKVTGNLQPQIQQGENINLTASIKNPESDTDSELMSNDNENGGRRHTYTRDMAWQYISFKANDINEVQSKFTDKNMLQQNGSDVCSVLGGVGISNFNSCNIRASGNNSLQIETKALSVSPFSTGIEPVGTVICVTLGVNNPTHSASSAWRIVKPVCTTVIKSPKVQFKYGDVNTGRPPIGAGDCQTNPNARIETTGAPNVALVEPNPLERHKYGSWGEYGVFSSGSIIAFGSSGAEAGTTDKAKRLTFGNDTSGYGAYAYNIKCIPNLMNGFSAQDTISSSTIYPNEYFNEAGRDTKSRFQKTGDINLAQRPVDKYKVKVSIVGSGDWGNDIPLNQGGELSPPKIKVKLDLKDSSISRTKTVDVPSQDRNNTTPTEIWFDENELPTDGWKGVGNVSVKFDNNNANWYWDNMRPQMRDRNLYISTMQVQWYKNEVEIANTGAKLATQLNKVDGIDYIRDDPVRCTQREGNPASWQWWENNVSFDEKILAFPPSESDARIGRGGGSCFGIHMDANTLAGYDGRFNQQYPPPPVLSSEYDGFNGRNIILYAQKKQAGDCGAGGVEGNLYINLDILYKISGYNNLSQIPRFTLMADCNIIIADNVQNVRASLIAGNAIQTCSNIAKSQNVCNKPLTITGAIQAKKLLLYRTSGADLTSAGDAKTPAETFEYGVDQMMAGYEYGLVNPVLKPVYQRDLPPRY